MDESSKQDKTDPAVSAIENVLAKRAAAAIEAALDRQERLRKRAEEGPPLNKRGRTGYTKKSAAARDVRWQAELSAADANVQALLDSANQFLRTKQPERMMEILTKSKAMTEADAAFAVVTGDAPPSVQKQIAENTAEVQRKLTIDEEDYKAAQPLKTLTDLYVKMGKTEAEAQEMAATSLVTQLDRDLELKKQQAAYYKAQAEAEGISDEQKKVLNELAKMAEIEVDTAKNAAKERRLYVGDHPESAKPGNLLSASLAWQNGMTQTSYQNALNQGKDWLVGQFGQTADTFISTDMSAFLRGTSDGKALSQAINSKKITVPDYLVQQYGSEARAYRALTAGTTFRALGVNSAADFYTGLALGLVKTNFHTDKLTDFIDMFLESDMEGQVKTARGLETQESYDLELADLGKVMKESLQQLYTDPEQPKFDLVALTPSEIVALKRAHPRLYGHIEQVAKAINHLTLARKRMQSPFGAD